MINIYKLDYKVAIIGEVEHMEVLMTGKKRVAVIFGGQSSEHEVSRVSAESVIKNINRDKYDVIMIGITKDGRWLHYDGPADKLGTGEWQALAEGKARLRTLNGADRNVTARYIFQAIGAESEDAKIDVAFPVLHGCNGEDGTIQGLFELAEIPYVGCGVLGSALGMDKAYAKIVFEKEGLPQCKHLVFSRRQVMDGTDALIAAVEAVLSYPCFVKPSNAGSSVGVNKAHNREELARALILAAGYDIRILVEEFVNGREIECAVLGNDNPEASVPGEIVPCNEFYDYNAKYIDNKSVSVIPAELPGEISAKIREYAVRAFKALDCTGLSRVDFFVHKDTGEIFINEINTLPGFTSISMYPQMWAASGVTYDRLIDRLVELAFERYGGNKRAIDK